MLLILQARHHVGLLMCQGEGKRKATPLTLRQFVIRGEDALEC